MVLAAMDPDDRVDILEHVPEPLHDAILDEMAADEAAEVRSLEQYPPDTAGGIMTTEVTALPEDLTVEQAIDELRRLSEELEQMFYVYVVDRRGHLVGVLSMRDLILARPDRDARRDHDRRTSAACRRRWTRRRSRGSCGEYGYLAMPVVDEKQPAGRHRSPSTTSST